MLAELKQMMELSIARAKDFISKQPDYIDTSPYDGDLASSEYWLRQVNQLIEGSLPSGTPITIMIEVPLTIGETGFYSCKKLKTIDDCKEEALLDVAVQLQSNELKFTTHKIG